MPDTMEKLIELLECTYGAVANRDYDCYGECKTCQAETLIANGVGFLPKWIPVTERLPEKSGDYLALTYNGFIERLSYSERHNAFNTDDRLMYAECAIPCTHWMPLPEPPKGE